MSGGCAQFDSSLWPISNVISLASGMLEDYTCQIVTGHPVVQDCTTGIWVACRPYLSCLPRAGLCQVGPEEATELAEKRPPSVRARQLAAELRRLREAATLTGEAAAAALGWSPSKISRIETARIAVSTGDLRRLLDLYQVSGSLRERLTELGRTAGQRGWWDAYADAMTSGYSTLIALEADAESERHFAPIIIPGLLQTERYAHEITRSSLLFAPPGEISRLAQVRMNRQKVLTRDKPLRLHVILDESVLLRQIGDTETMKGQLSHLAELAAHPNIMLQILPLSAGPHLSLSGVFTIVRFPEKIAFEVVFLENMTSDLFIENEIEVYRYGLAFDRLRELAMEEDESIALITRLAAETR
jgi:transcriptional regulator with XRE-family HTH domain